MDLTLVNLKAKVIRIEKEICELVSREVEEVRRNGGDGLANEMLMSIATLFAARAVSYHHVFTTEPIESVKKRFVETFDHNVKASLQILIKQTERNQV